MYTILKVFRCSVNVQGQSYLDSRNCRKVCGFYERYRWHQKYFKGPIKHSVYFRYYQDYFYSLPTVSVHSGTKQKLFCGFLPSGLLRSVVGLPNPGVSKEINVLLYKGQGFVELVRLLDPWRWGRNVGSKRRDLVTLLLSVTFQEKWILNSVETSNLAQQLFPSTGLNDWSL
jgi:hypothetical protein